MLGESERLYEDLVSILGREKVSVSLVDRISYSHDYWPLLLIELIRGKTPYLPDVIVFPENESDVIEVVRYAYERDIPLYPYGGGT